MSPPGRKRAANNLGSFRGKSHSSTTQLRLERGQIQVKHQGQAPRYGGAAAVQIAAKEGTNQRRTAAASRAAANIRDPNYYPQQAGTIDVDEEDDKPKTKRKPKAKKFPKIDMAHLATPYPVGEKGALLQWLNAHTILAQGFLREVSPFIARDWALARPAQELKKAEPWAFYGFEAMMPQFKSDAKKARELVRLNFLMSNPE